MNRTVPLLWLGALLLVAGQASAQINKCVDNTGKTIYLQSPCPANSKASSIRSAPPSPAAPSPDGKSVAKGPASTAELERDFRKRRTEQEELAKKNAEKATEAKDREENCRSARAQLASLESGARQQRVDEKGERVFLDDSQLGVEADRARKAVQAWCK